MIFGTRINRWIKICIDVRKEGICSQNSNGKRTDQVTDQNTEIPQHDITKAHG